MDFDNDRLWMKDHILTDRIIRERTIGQGPFSRRIYRAVVRAADRIVGSGLEIYGEGGALWIGGKDRSSSEQIGLIEGPKSPRHPLCVLTPISLVKERLTNPEDYETIRGEATTCFGLILTAGQFDWEIWTHIAQLSARPRQATPPESLRKAIRAFIWLDTDTRIRRMSYESSYDAPTHTTLWSITELWDFGVNIPQESPLGLNSEGAEAIREHR